MKKYDKSKRHLRWILPLCTLIVLAIAAAAVLMLRPAAPTESAPQEQKLYWNVDGKSYRSGQNVRYAGNDGYVYMTFAVDGEQVRVPVADYALAVAIDMQEVVGLVFDENGVAVDYMRVSEFTGGILANRFYVTNMDGNTVTCNSSVTLNGYDVTFEITENTGVYDVGTEGITCGIPGTVKLNDQVTVITDTDGSAMCVYTVTYSEPGALYWNVTRKYNSISKRSTREMDEFGCYSYEMLCNGETVTVRIKDYEIACQMDGYNAPCMGLVFDENGYVIETMHAKKVTGGGIFGSYSRVTQISGAKLYTKKLTGTGIGTEYTGILAENCKIINTTSVGTRGEYTTLRCGDQIHGLTDSRGKLCYIFITSRVCQEEYGFCWNFDYVSGAAETARKPDKDGVYHIKLACDGQVFTGWTKDPDMVNMLDTSRFRGVKLGADNEIMDVIPANYVYGGSYFCSWYYVDKIEGDQITVSFTKNTDSETKVLTGTLSEDVQVYNTSKLVSSYQGEASTLQAGDQIYAQNDMYGRIRAIYVVNRYLRTGVYYNLDRKWNDTDKCTTRTPDENGLYTFRMAYNGKQVTVRTKSLQVANDIDSQVAKVLGLVMDKNGYAIKAVHANQTEECKGSVSVSYVLVTGISGNRVTTYKENNGEKKTITLSTDVKYINVSSLYDDHQGEYTKLRVGDKIHCLMDQEKKTNYVFITSRKPITVKHACQHDGDLWYTWNGKTNFTESGSYVLTDDLTLSKRITIKAGQEITLCLNGHNITCTDRVFSIYGKLTLCDHKKEDGTYGGSIVTSYSNVLDEEGNITAKVYGGLAYLYNEDQDVQLDIRGGNYIHTGSVSAAGLVYVANKSDSGFSAVFNLYDGVLTGGNATESGGAVAVRNVGVFNMYGGTVTDCKAVTGAGIHLQSAKANFNMTGGLIQNCSATDVGAGICIGNGTAVMTGGKVTGCGTTGNGGSVNITSGSFTMTGGSLEGGSAKEGGNLRIGGAAAFTLGGNAVITDGSATNGGNAVVYGTLNIQDNAVMKDGTATNKGGNINAFANLAEATANINMTGGTVSGGKAAVDSGSVRLDTNEGWVNMTVTGGTISAGEAPHASCVKVGTAEHISMTVGGTARIAEIYLESGKRLAVHTDGLKETASIGVAMSEANAPFTTIAEPAQQASFHPADPENARIENQENTLYLQVWHHHCVCGGSLTGAALDAHKESCQEVEEWTSVCKESFEIGGIFVAASTTGRVNFAESSGHYYLTEDVTTKYVLEILKGTQVSLCLNGHTLTSTATGNSAIRLSGKLTICDCRGGGKITSSSPKAPGMVFMLTSTADAAAGVQFDLYGGDLVMTDNNYTANAGVVQVGNSGSNKAVFNMYGGSISGGTANKGGNILIGTAAATMNLYGGSISGGSVKTNDSSKDRNRGGNIYVNKGTLNVYGGSISGGMTTAEDPNPGLGGDIFQLGGRVYLNSALGNLDYANDGTGSLTVGENFSGTVLCSSLKTGRILMATGVTELQAAFFKAKDEAANTIAVEDDKIYLTDLSQ